MYIYMYYYSFVYAMYNDISHVDAISNFQNNIINSFKLAMIVYSIYLHILEKRALRLITNSNYISHIEHSYKEVRYTIIIVADRILLLIEVHYV